MSNLQEKNERISIEQGTWYYITMDYLFQGFASFSFVKYTDVIDGIGNGIKRAVIVRFLDKGYFPIQDLLLVPYRRNRNYFKARSDEALSVSTYDASKFGNAYMVDLKSEWPNNMLDRAAITPSFEKARQLAGL